MQPSYYGQQLPHQSYKATNPYQQLKYLYQTENYEQFLELVDQLRNMIQENRDLKTGVFEELSHLQNQLETRQHIDTQDKELRYIEEMELLNKKYEFNPQVPSDLSVEDKLKVMNKNLRELLNNKLSYNKQLLEIIEEYQQSLVVIVKKLYLLFEDPRDDLQNKLDELQRLRSQVLEELNSRTLRLSQLSALNNILINP